MGFALDKPDHKSERATRVTFQRYIRLDKSDNKFSNINILQNEYTTSPGLLAVTGIANFSSFIHETKVHFFLAALWLCFSVHS